VELVGNRRRTSRTSLSGERTLSANRLDGLHRFTKLEQPLVGVCSNELDAPSQRIGTTTSDAAVDKRVQNASFGLAKSSHDRYRQVGEDVSGLANLGSPTEGSTEEVLALSSYCHALFARLFAKPSYPSIFGGRRGRGISLVAQFWSE
jgi:hypothetical protein